MLTTFENAERQHLRRLERERHSMNIINMTATDGIFQLPFGIDDMPHAVDALAGVPLAKPSDDEERLLHDNNSRPWWRKHKRLTFAAVVSIALAIILGFSLGVDLGEHEGKSENQIANEDSSTKDESDNRYNFFVSHILDWNYTEKERLQDASSAQAKGTNKMLNFFH